MNNITSLLGLAFRAGKLAVGEDPVLAACSAHKAPLLLIASDAAENSARRAMQAGQSGNAVCLTLPFDKQQLGAGVGRASCAMAAVTDAGFAASVTARLAAADPVRYGEANELLSAKAARQKKRRDETRARKKAEARNRKTK